MDATRGIQYSPDDNGIGGRGLSTMGGVSPVSPMIPPIAPKNGLAEAGDGDPAINAPPRPNELSDRYATQPVPDIWPVK